MCVIVYKKQGVALPSMDILEDCFYSNPDGAGLLFIKNGKCHISKGFMSFDSFEKRLKSLKFTKKDTVFFHFRIGTSGGNSRGNCHPFPISNDIDKLKKLDTICSRAFLHNGIIGEGTSQLSDTQLFVRDKLYPLQDFLEEEAIQEFIDKSTLGSRTVTIDAAKNVIFLTGDWKEKNGLLFSNLNHEFINNYNVFEYENNLKDYPKEQLCPQCCSNDIVFSQYGYVGYCFDCRQEFDPGVDLCDI